MGMLIYLDYKTKCESEETMLAITMILLMKHC